MNAIQIEPEGNFRMRMISTSTVITRTETRWVNGSGSGCLCLSRTIAALGMFLVFALLSTNLAVGQVANGTITGIVTDSTGAIIPGADVTVTQKATGLVQHAQTNRDGVYNFLQLQPGQYTVVVAKPGFKKINRSLTLTVAQVIQADVQLPIGSESQTVTVQAESSAQLETQTSNLDYTVGPKQVDELPLNGRNAYGLAALSPGVAPGANFGAGLSTVRGAVVSAGSNNFESNGGISGSNEILLDGVSITVCCQGQPPVVPTLEILGQFKVITSNPSAEYGRSSGGFLNIVTKSGSNVLHGDVYDYLRNQVLDAANFFTKRSGVYPFPGHNDFRLPHRYNQFGGFVSGPVFLPRLYNGSNKTFFLFGYEGTRNFAPTYQTVTVPTALMRQGIFTEAPAPIYDPTSYNAATGQRTLIPAACSGSTCYPAGRYIPTIDPVAQKLLTLLPAPNQPGIVNNYGYASNVTDDENQLNFRVDHNFSANNRTFVRGTRDTDVHYNNGLFNEPDGPNSWQQHITSYLFAIGHLWTPSPTLLFQFTYGFARQQNVQIGGNSTNAAYNAGNYGFSSLFTSQQQTQGLPQITFSGLQAISWGDYFNGNAHYAHTLNGIGVLQRGHHTLTFGYNGKMILENAYGLTNPLGNFAFGSSFTNGPNPNGAVPSGQGSFDSWAAFLYGYPSSGSIIRQDTVAFNQFYDALFVQDDWRLSHKLTVNLGLRWDIETGFKERNNHWADFDPNATNPLSASTGIPFTGGAQYLGTAGNPSRTSPTSYTKFAPRVGFAYAPVSNTVVRGGYGILYLPITERAYADGTLGYSQTTNMLTTIDGFTPVNVIDNPFPTGVALPQGSSAGVTVGTGSSPSVFLYNNPIPYEQQWNFGVQQGLGRGIVFSLDYAGSHGVKLPQNLQPNNLNPKYFGAPGDQTQVAYLQTLVANPFYGAANVVPGSALANPTVQRQQLLAAFPQYSSISYLYQDRGSASYNALQSMIAVNHANGLSGSLVYTWSKLIGNVTDLVGGFTNETGNPGYQNYYLIKQYERSVLPTDVPHRVVGNLTYALPFGRERHFGSQMPGWANELAGGWNLTAIISVQSGYPLSLTQSGGAAFSGSRPTYVAGVNPLTTGSVHQRLGSKGLQGYFNPAAFRLSQSFELGNVPRDAAALRGPLTFQDDVSAVKNFGIFKDLTGEFRLEAFNVLNKVQFGLPGTQFGSSSFGVISSQYNLPRNVQVALKLHF